MITFLEHREPGYALRTVANARAADLTIAFAVDFKTPGEILTHKAAYNKYVGIHFLYLHPEEMISSDGVEPPFAVETSVLHLKLKKAKHINFAGNGIYTLNQPKYNLEQDHVDVLFLNYLAQLIEIYPHIKTIRSGGQTGVDEAALKAADKLGLDCICLAPKNWLFRDINGKDHMRDPDAFCARFGENYINNI